MPNNNFVFNNLIYCYNNYGYIEKQKGNKAWVDCCLLCNFNNSRNILQPTPI